MNVLGFMASPRKGGNSDVLLDRFLEGARSQGAQAEKIYLYDCSIEYCRAATSGAGQRRTAVPGGRTMCTCCTTRWSRAI